MDSISEERSMAAIRQVASDSILIIVSHKLKTLATADEIIVLESGQLTAVSYTHLTLPTKA